jgi:hypothetical protein
LAIRERLREAWPPRHAGEALLIDELAQYEFLRTQWVAVLAMHSREPALPQRAYVPESEPRRLSAVESTAEAVRMVESLQRLFQNTLRVLVKARGEKAVAKSVRSATWAGVVGTVGTHPVSGRKPGGQVF